jgi:hypothetical protein
MLSICNLINIIYKAVRTILRSVKLVKWGTIDILSTGTWIFCLFLRFWYLVLELVDSVVLFVLELVRQCGVVCFRIGPTVWCCLFYNGSDSVVLFVLELVRQCGVVCFRIGPTVWCCLFYNWSDSVVLFVLELVRQCGVVCFRIDPTVWCCLF